MTKWTFSSVKPGEGQQEIVPLLNIDYALNLNLNNISVRSEADGVHDVRFQVSHQPGAESSPIEEANAWVSYDDGEKWQKINDVEHLGNGEFKASLSRHDIPEGSGFVSLKVQAWDNEQNSVEQEIISLSQQLA